MSVEVEFNLVEESNGLAVEASADAALMQTANDVRLVIEACMYHRAEAVLLYPKNLPPGFFDLSSREAGDILQKLRNYQIRLAIVCVNPADVQFSSRFGEMLAEESKGPHFGVFSSREQALDWANQFSA